MSRLYLVRHGEAAAGFDADHDPGLSDRGRQQAAAAAQTLAPLGPLPILVSPLRRTRETAAPLADTWDIEPLIESRVAEIPSPTDDLVERTVWLRKVMTGSWASAAPELLPWRTGVVDCLLACDTDTVVVSHVVAINVAVGYATDDDRALCFMPANASITIVENAYQRLRLVELGRSASETVVL